MYYTIQPAADGDYILIEVRGVIDRKHATRITLESHALGRELGFRKYLMDLTDAVNQEPANEQYQYANHNLNTIEGLDHYALCAALVDPADHSHDFIETVIRNAGFNFRLFRDHLQAMAFLGCGDAAQKRRG